MFVAIVLKTFVAKVKILADIASEVSISPRIFKLAIVTDMVICVHDKIYQNV